MKRWEFLGGPVVRTACFHGWELGFHPWLGPHDPASLEVWWSKKKKEKWRTDACYNTDELDNIILHERRQSQKALYGMMLFMWYVQNRQSCRLKADWWLPAAGGTASGEWLLIDAEFLYGIMKMSWNWIVVIAAQLCKFTKNHWIGTSLVAQWIRMCLPMQGTWVQSLVQEDSTCCRATKPVCCNYWNPWAQSLCSTREAMAMRSPHTTTKSSPSSPQLEKKACAKQGDQVQPKNK